MQIQTLILILLITLITIGIIITAEPPVQALGGFWFLNNDFIQINTTASGGINRVNVSEYYGGLGCGNITGSNTNLCNIQFTEIFNASLIDLQTGTLDNGNLNSIQNQKEGNSYNISEVTGTPGFNTIINFTNVTNFNSILLRLWYDGGSGHTIHIGLWDFVTEEYEEEYGEISDMEDFSYVSSNVFDASSHINEGNVSLRLIHDDSGIPSHNFYIDYAVLINGISTVLTTEHDSLSGRNSNNNHIWAMPTDASRNFTGNVNISNNLTVSERICSKDGCNKWIILNSTGVYIQG